MIQKILVPTDFSQLAESALNAAAEISRKTGASIELLHVVESPYSKDFSSSGTVAPADVMDDIYVLTSIEMAKQKMTAIADDVKFAGIRFYPKIKTGSPYTHFTEIIVKENIDLIVMGTEGTSGWLKGVFAKSNTEEVVMNANCMVLAVKKDTKNFKIKNVLYATNFKDDSPDFILNLKNLQEIFEFKLHITYVNSVLDHTDNIEKIKNEYKSFERKYKLQNSELKIREDFTEFTGITELAKELNADLIALTTHQRKGFWHWIGGLSEDLVNLGEKPVLTYKAD